MFSFQKWNSWSLVVVIATVVALVSVIHLFLSSEGPSLDDFGARQVEILENSSVQVNGSREESKSVVPDNRSNGGNNPTNSSIEDSKQINGSVQQGRDYRNKKQRPIIDLSVQFPADSQNAVVYRGAPWKAEIGRWLSGCDVNTVAVKIVEVLYICDCQGCLQLSSLMDN